MAIIFTVTAEVKGSVVEFNVFMLLIGRSVCVQQESAPDVSERQSIMEALRADAAHLLSEYDAHNPAGNRLQRQLLNCEHAFQLLNDRSQCFIHQHLLFLWKIN